MLEEIVAFAIREGLALKEAKVMMDMVNDDPDYWADKTLRQIYDRSRSEVEVKQQAYTRRY